MELSFEDVSDQLRRVCLTGRLDIEGTDVIATKFSALVAASDRRVVVDLTGVTFLASIGIRALISAGKAQQQRGGRIALLVTEKSTVATTLEVTGVDEIMPILNNLAQADAAALA
jgi:anti-sigma B factor antagonist